MQTFTHFPTNLSKNHQNGNPNFHLLLFSLNYHHLLRFLFFSSLAKPNLQLIHRDSPHSPLYNPLHIVFDRLNAAFSPFILPFPSLLNQNPSPIRFSRNRRDYFPSISTCNQSWYEAQIMQR
ncbi:unnamed protein product [Brassica oleracea]